jgi:hypothetical protein
MNSRFVYIIFWFIFASLNSYSWKKTKDRDFLWYLGVGVVGLLAELVYEYLILSNASQAALAMVNNFLYVFDPIGAVVFIWVIIRSLIGGSRRSGRDPSGR